MKRKSLIAILMFLLVSMSSCSREAVKIDSLDVDFSRIEKLEIEYPGRKRINTDVIIESGKDESISGWIDGYRMDGKTLRITLGGDLSMTIPEDGAIREIDVKIASGSILVKGIDELHSLEAHSAAGSIKLLELGKIDSIEAESAAGRIQVEAESSKDVNLKTASGEISFRGRADNLKIRAVASNVKIETDAEMDLDFKTVTGRSDFNGKRGNEMKVDVKTTTGNLYVEGI